MSSKSSRGGIGILSRAKYGMTRNAAIGRWKTEPSSSERIVPHQDQIAPLEVVIAYCVLVASAAQLHDKR
ncbi:unnamed protein product [Mycena citricolor]|uniref:Uncharacterized protein n=1 Tax=Mycena citricolor TaxID=2018698 RepID=A0AAD2GWT0_9AGAR|nr:unnamed protein product [Mycena citricolor]CAK5276268.1 unnamed protein product [Mycena citricolor]